MGCCNQRTIEDVKKINSGFPVCILTVPLQKEVGSLAPLNDKKLVLGAKDELLLTANTLKEANNNS